MKNMKKINLISAVAALALSIGLGCTIAQAQEACGTVSISNMNWQSAELIANVDAYILTHGFGCNVELINGDTVPTLISMAEKGVPDIGPEIRSSLLPETASAMIERGDLLVVGSSIPEGADQGIYIPKFIVDANPEIRTVADAVKRPDLFPDAEDPGKGAWSAGQQGWGGTVVLTQFYKAYGAEAAGWNLVDTGSAAGHDGSLIRAYERGIGWLGYMWEPTAILGRYEMFRLDEDVDYDEAEWVRCYRSTDCADPKPNRWVKDEVSAVITKNFAARAGVAPVLDYFKKRGFKNASLNQMMVWMDDNQATGDVAAAHYLKTYPQEWEAWLPPEIVEKIKASL